MKPPYLNGRDELPPALLAEVQKHCTGMVWIPKPNAFFDERRQLILSLRDQGVPTQEIAELSELSVRRVNQIIAGKNGHENRQSKARSGK